jgi:hypothetical protein
MSFEKEIARVKKAAQYAWNWVSWSPEKRAASFVEQFTKDIEAFSAQVKEIDAGSVEDFAKRYTDKAVEYLNALSRTASSAVTGPANFPVRRNEAAQKRERAKSDEFYSYADYYLKKLDKKVKRETGYHKPDSELERQKELVIDAEKTHQMNLEGNRILRAGGDSEAVRKKLEAIGVSPKWVDFYIRERHTDGRFIHGFGSTNSNSRLKRAKERLDLLEKKVGNAGTEATKLVFEGGYIIKNAEEDRLQILFDGMPDADTRGVLKRNGYRWSPRNKAWQRQLTHNAIYSLSYIFSTLGITAEQFKAWNEAKSVVPISAPKLTQPPAPVMKIAHVAPEVKKNLEFIGNWQEKILGHLQMEIGVDRSDAQGMLLAKNAELMNAYNAGTSAGDAFDAVWQKTKADSKPPTENKPAAMAPKKAKVLLPKEKEKRDRLKPGHFAVSVYTEPLKLKMYAVNYYTDADSALEAESIVVERRKKDNLKVYGFDYAIRLGAKRGSEKKPEVTTEPPTDSIEKIKARALAVAMAMKYKYAAK